MWWHDKGMDRSVVCAPRGAGRREAAPTPMGWAQGGTMRPAAALVIAALAGGCFQPLYGEQSPTGGPILRDQLSAVDVLQIVAPKGTDEARIAVEIRNSLLYDFTGGGFAPPPPPPPKNPLTAPRPPLLPPVKNPPPPPPTTRPHSTHPLTPIPTPHKL